MKIITAMKNVFGSKNLIESGVVADPEFKPCLPLDIFQDLPPMPVSKIGPNGETLYKMIADAYPEGILYPKTRENRIKLYQSILFLRTKSSKPWVYDVETSYVREVPVLNRVVAIPHISRQAC